MNDYSLIIVNHLNLCIHRYLEIIFTLSKFYIYSNAQTNIIAINKMKKTRIERI